MSLDLTHCTLTGVDAKTNLDAIARLSEEFPLVEWGFLYSPTRQGWPGRYPANDFLVNAFRGLPQNVRVALHVCGDGVTNLLQGKRMDRRLTDLVVARGGRVQLNFDQSRCAIPIDNIASIMTLYPEATFITQGNVGNRGVWQVLADRGVSNHAVLFDSSGGRGIACADWPAPILPPCGYAGGLGPANLGSELDRIHSVAGNRPIWIDMEGKLRRPGASDADWLDIDACRTCLEAVREFQTPATVA